MNICSVILVSVLIDYRIPKTYEKTIIFFIENKKNYDCRTNYAKKLNIIEK
jgi:hypothetical protein